MHVFACGMERSGTHSVANIIRSACKLPSYIAHEDRPFLCREAKLLFDGKDFRTDDLREKIRLLRRKGKEFSLVCEANHRFGYFIALLMREFAPDCKFIFTIRDPVQTIISRLGIWAHFPDFLNKYPDFYKKKIEELDTPVDFNKYRISPPKSFVNKSLVEIYLWEWIQNYEAVRNQFACIPRQNRFIIFTEDLTSKFDHMLGFIGMEYFKVDDEVMGWARVKSDSIYIQEKERETDVFVTQNRDPLSDETVLFAKREVANCGGIIASEIKNEFAKFHSDVDEDLVDMDNKIIQKFVKMM